MIGFYREPGDPLSPRTQRFIVQVAMDEVDLTLAEIAERFGCTARQVQLALRRAGISPAERARARLAACHPPKKRAAGGRR